MIWLLACGRGAPDSGQSAPAVEVTDMASYLAACEAALGPLPPFDCSMGSPIPVTVTDAAGVHEVRDSSELEGGNRCDRPSIAGCWTGARMGVMVNEQGTPWVFVCRSYDDDPSRYEQLNLIGWDRESGAACFLNTPHHETSFDGSSIPRPGSAEDLAFFPDQPLWYTLERLGGASCVACHDNDPWLRNPFIEQVGVLPEGRPLGAFQPVAQEVLRGFSEDWDLQPTLVHPDAAACTSCHRLSAGRTCNLAQDASGRDKHGRTTDWYRRWPQRLWMPHYDPADLVAELPTEEAWEQDYGLAADTIVACCGETPPEGCWSD